MPDPPPGHDSWLPVGVSPQQISKMASTQIIDFGLGGGSGEDEEDEDRGPPLATLQWNKKFYNLYSGDNLLGRSKKCDIQLDQTSVSDSHCEIEIIQTKTTIQAICKDLRSSNGTFVERNSQKKDFVRLGKGKKMEIKSGCQLRLGLINLCFEFVSKSLEDEYDIPSSPEAGGREGAGGVGAADETQYMPDDDEILDEEDVTSSKTSVVTPPAAAVLGGRGGAGLGKKKLSTVEEASVECDPYDIVTDTDDDDERGEGREGSGAGAGPSRSAPPSAVAVTEEEPTQLMEDEGEGEEEPTQMPPDDGDIPTEEDESDEQEEREEKTAAPTVEDEATEEDEPVVGEGDGGDGDESLTEGEDDATSYLPPSSLNVLIHTTAMTTEALPMSTPVSRPLPITRSDTLSSNESEEMTHDHRPILVDNEAIKLMLPTTMFGSPSPVTVPVMTDVSPSSPPFPTSDNQQVKEEQEREKERQMVEQEPSPKEQQSARKAPPRSSGLKRFIINDDDTDEEEAAAHTSVKVLALSIKTSDTSERNEEAILTPLRQEDERGSGDEQDDTHEQSATTSPSPPPLPEALPALDREVVTADQQQEEQLVIASERVPVVERDIVSEKTEIEIDPMEEVVPALPVAVTENIPSVAQNIPIIESEPEGRKKRSRYQENLDEALKREEEEETEPEAKRGKSSSVVVGHPSSEEEIELPAVASLATTRRGRSKKIDTVPEPVCRLLPLVTLDHSCRNNTKRQRWSKLAVSEQERRLQSNPHLQRQNVAKEMRVLSKRQSRPSPHSSERLKRSPQRQLHP
jgi:hypothetical protein